MKNKSYLILLLLTIVALTSCKKNDMEYRNDFDKSYDSWLSFKQSYNNSYRYIVQFGSWTGYSSETIITVNGGKVVKRSYVGKTIERPSNAVVIREEWNEEASTLNTHESGATTATLDEIYQKAKNDWLLKRKDANTYFESNNAGMISSCGYVPINCTDDCFTGISIKHIEKL